MERESSLDSLEPNRNTNFKVRIKSLESSGRATNNSSAFFTNSNILHQLYDNCHSRASPINQEDLIIHENRVYASSSAHFTPTKNKKRYADVADTLSEELDTDSLQVKNGSEAGRFIKILNDDSLIFIPTNAALADDTTVNTATVDIRSLGENEKRCCLSEAELSAYSAFIKGSFSKFNDTSDFVEIFHDQTNVVNANPKNPNPFVFNSKSSVLSEQCIANGCFDNDNYLKQSFKCKITSPYSSFNNKNSSNCNRTAASTLEKALNLQRQSGDHIRTDFVFNGFLFKNVEGGVCSSERQTASSSSSSSDGTVKDRATFEQKNC
jgi:hypothetical protein